MGVYDGEFCGYLVDDDVEERIDCEIGYFYECNKK